MTNNVAVIVLVGAAVVFIFAQKGMASTTDGGGTADPNFVNKHNKNINTWHKKQEKKHQAFIDNYMQQHHSASAAQDSANRQAEWLDSDALKWIDEATSHSSPVPSNPADHKAGANKVDWWKDWDATAKDLAEDSIPGAGELKMGVEMLDEGQDWARDYLHISKTPFSHGAEEAGKKVNQSFDKAKEDGALAFTSGSTQAAFDIAQAVGAHAPSIAGFVHDTGPTPQQLADQIWCGLNPLDDWCNTQGFKGDK